MIALNMFMEEMVAGPYLRTDKSLLAFISVQDSRDWEAAKKATAQTTETTYDDRDFAVRGCWLTTHCVCGPQGWRGYVA